jgi:hypothetical protein
MPPGESGGDDPLTVYTAACGEHNQRIGGPRRLRAAGPVPLAAALPQVDAIVQAVWDARNA